MTKQTAKIILIGKPGSGKGSVCSELKTMFNLVHISAGDLLRAEMKNGKVLNESEKEKIGNGELVSNETIIKILMPEIVKYKRTGIIFDGFPRNLAQAEMLDDVLKELDESLTNVIEIQVDDSILEQRICGRRIHPSSGRLYHIDFNPPNIEGLDDITGEPLVQRIDDTPDVLEARLREYYKETHPLLDYYKKQGVLTTIDGSKDIKQTLENVIKAFSSPLTEFHQSKVGKADEYVSSVPGAVKDSSFKMQHLDTYEVMKNKVGQWYKQKDLGAYIILEGKRKNTKMSIGFDKECADEFSPLSNETGSVLKEKVLYDKISRTETPKVVQHTSRNGLKLAETMKSRCINSFIKEENTELENRSKHNEISRKSTKSNAHTIKHSNYPVDNEKNGVDPSLCLDCKSRRSIKPVITLDQMEMFAKENTALIVAWNFIAIAIAVSASVFCFLFPNSKEWANDKWAHARQYQIKLSKLAMQLPSGLKKHRTAVTKAWTNPLIWIWRFFSCLGKCIGITLPVLPKCIYCIINCFKDTNIEEYDKTLIQNEKAITQSEEPLFETKSDGRSIRAESNLAKYPEWRYSEAYISRLSSNSKLRPKTQEQGHSVKLESHESHSII